VTMKTILRESMADQSLQAEKTPSSANPRPAPLGPPFTTGMGAASGVDRQTAKVSFSALSSRVASAARRVAANLDLDAREKEALLQVQTVLSSEADSLRQVGSRPRQPDSYASYSFAQFTHTALTAGHRRKKIKLEEAASNLEDLARDIGAMLAGDVVEAKKAAAKVSAVFSRVSTTLLAQVGSPGDTLGGRRGQ
jgi:hypothetical protein